MNHKLPLTFAAKILEAEQYMTPCNKVYGAQPNPLVSGRKVLTDEEWIAHAAALLSNKNPNLDIHKVSAYKDVFSHPQRHLLQLGGGRHYYNTHVPNLKAYDVSASSSNVHVLPKPGISKPPQSAPQNQFSSFNVSNPSLGNFVWPSQAANISGLANPNYSNLYGLNLPNQAPILYGLNTEKQARLVLENSMPPFPLVHPMSVSAPQMFPSSSYMQHPEDKEEENEKEKGNEGKEKKKEGNENDDELNLELKL